MAGVPWAVNVYYDPPQCSTFHAQAHEGRQALVFKAKVGEQRAQLLLDTGTIDRSFINAAMCKEVTDMDRQIETISSHPYRK